MRTNGQEMDHVQSGARGQRNQIKVCTIRKCSIYRQPVLKGPEFRPGAAIGCGRHEPIQECRARNGAESMKIKFEMKINRVHYFGTIAAFDFPISTTLTSVVGVALAP